MAQKTELQVYGLPGQRHGFIAKAEAAAAQFLYAILTIERTATNLSVAATKTALTVDRSDTALSIEG